MTDPVDAKASTLAALAAWSATSRHELVASAWLAGNRSVAELARVAGVGRQAIYQDLQRHEINPPTDREEPPVVPTKTEPTTVPVPGWRHPNLLSVKSEVRYGETIFTYEMKPFTGDEPEPEMPDEWSPSNTEDETDWTAYEQRGRETRWVRRAWADARYLRLIQAVYDPNHRDRALLDALMRQRHPEHFFHQWSHYSHPVGYDGTAGDVWASYVAARDELAAAYEAMKTQPDNQWRAGLGRIVDCTEPAQKAAGKWDDVAEVFVAVTIWYSGYVHSEEMPGTQTAIIEAAKKLGIDAAGWRIAYDLSYYGHRSEYGDTARAEICSIIEKGQQWLKEVGKLAGDR